jgi:hypothetical protein
MTTIKSTTPSAKIVRFDINAIPKKPRAASVRRRKADSRRPTHKALAHVGNQ